MGNVDGFIRVILAATARFLDSFFHGNGTLFNPLWG